MTKQRKVNNSMAYNPQSDAYKLGRKTGLAAKTADNAQQKADGVVATAVEFLIRQSDDNGKIPANVGTDYRAGYIIARVGKSEFEKGSKSDLFKRARSASNSALSRARQQLRELHGIESEKDTRGGSNTKTKKDGRGKGTGKKETRAPTAQAAVDALAAAIVRHGNGKGGKVTPEAKQAREHLEAVAAFLKLKA